jgi:probable addiction module antidote protein
MRSQAAISHDESVIRRLRESPKFAVEYLKAALEEADEPKVLLIALRRIAEAKGGVAKIAKAAGVKRESLYRALSAKGNPRLSTLVAVTKAVGLKLTVEGARPIDGRGKRAKTRKERREKSSRVAK